MSQRTIYIVPIEPLDERYTSQWYRNFPEAFWKAGFAVETINGVPLLDNEIKVGAFLDINSTVHYKMSQLQAIAKMFHAGTINNGDIFFFGDIEFWGLESLRLMAQMNGVDVKITGFLHAASYTKEDAFAVAADYQQYTELGWVAACDKVFVGSAYHKQAFLKRRVLPTPNGRTEDGVVLYTHPVDRNRTKTFDEKIVVTKNPLFVDEYDDFGDVEKLKKILLTNRFDHEKRPGNTLKLFAALKARYPDWEFVVTTGRKIVRGAEEDLQLLDKLVAEGVVTVKAGLTKEEYHRELAEAYMVVSHSIEENYGYCIAEAIYYKCVPLLLQGVSHDEFVTSAYTFSQFPEMVDKLNPKEGTVHGLAKAIHWIERYNEPTPEIALDTSGMQNIINELKLL